METVFSLFLRLEYADYAFRHWHFIYNASRESCQDLNLQLHRKMVFCPIKLMTRIKKIFEEFEALTHSSLVCAHYQFVKMNRIETFMLCQMRFDLHLSDTLVR